MISLIIHLITLKIFHQMTKCDRNSWWNSIHWQKIWWNKKVLIWSWSWSWVSSLGFFRSCATLVFWHQKIRGTTMLINFVQYRLTYESFDSLNYYSELIVIILYSSLSRFRFKFIKLRLKFRSTGIWKFFLIFIYFDSTNSVESLFYPGEQDLIGIQWVNFDETINDIQRFT